MAKQKQKVGSVEVRYRFVPTRGKFTAEARDFLGHPLVTGEGDSVVDARSALFVQLAAIMRHAERPVEVPPDEVIEV